MKKNEVLSNEFIIKYDEESERVLIYTKKYGVLDSDVPISLRTEMLIEMGADAASKWMGQTIFLLVPELRKKLFGIKDD